MACYRIELLAAARKDLEKLDRPTAMRILGFLHDRVAKLEDPRSLGAALRGKELGEYWKYRVGDFRIIAVIEDDAIRILVVRIGHRSKVYEQDL